MPSKKSTVMEGFVMPNRKACLETETENLLLLKGSHLVLDKWHPNESGMVISLVWSSKERTQV